ncbi:hypothetical protein NDU88_011730 [Pleurodeles waltl]|uniref:Uncharacterized protein n=1 Tax=Pleurodeles waltl TaxID=8319 RepID=A0AAV7S4E1_PLEWA|nr:hypothetical protein NDU88_011730 [Pleurodeles waltl]
MPTRNRIQQSAAAMRDVEDAFSLRNSSRLAAPPKEPQRKRPENKVPIDLADAVTGINSEKDLCLGSNSSTRQEPERSAFGKESSKDEPKRPDCSGSILDLDFSVWEDSLPSTQARKELDLPDLDGTPDHPLIELIDTDSLAGDTSTEQGKTIHPHESSQKHEADMLRTIISLSPFQDSTRNSQLQSDVPANTWGTLLSTLDIMATAIKRQADKQDIQVDLPNIMAKYIVGIDSKLQALNDLIQRAQRQNYIQQVACDCAISGDNPQTIIPIINDILAEVRAQALSTRERLCVLEFEEPGKGASSCGGTCDQRQAAVEDVCPETSSRGRTCDQRQAAVAGRVTRDKQPWQDVCPETSSRGRTCAQRQAAVEDVCPETSSCGGRVPRDKQLWRTCAQRQAAVEDVCPETSSCGRKCDQRHAALAVAGPVTRGKQLWRDVCPETRSCGSSRTCDQRQASVAGNVTRDRQLWQKQDL